jgi:hypothetical protein
MNKDFKQTFLKAIKSENSILIGDVMCRNIAAVQNIKKNQKLTLAKKLDLLERYIKGIKEKSKTLTDMLEHSNVWEKESIEKCLKFLSSMGIDSKEDRKKYMDGLTGADEKKRVKETVDKSKIVIKKSSTKRKITEKKVPSRKTTEKKVPSRKSSVVLPKEYLDLFAEW